MKIEEEVLGAGRRKIRYTHVKTGSDTICFMFSGSGYTYNKPLFYYAAMVMLQNKVDFVQIHYQYDEDLQKQSLKTITETMMNDVDSVMGAVLHDSRYKETVFLGKSLGTIPIANVLMKKQTYLQSKMILLTPLLNYDPIYQSILNSRHTGLLVIGDQDRHYRAELIGALHKTCFQIKVVKNGDHSLDVGTFDTAESIAALAEIMEKIQEVIVAER